MKTKTKILAFVEITVVLCSLFLVALPAIAAEQNVQQELQKVSATVVTTTSEDDYVLEIYGNGNEDDTIDMGDVVYTKLVIFGKKPKTELCDAKYDGRINVLDVIQTKLIILGKEKELTFIDSDGDVITVPTPVNRIVIEYNDRAELMRSLDVRDKVVGVDISVNQQPKFYPELSKLPGVGRSGDYEAILSLNPDVFIAYHGKKNYEEKLPSVTIIWLDLGDAETLAENIRIFGYILDKRDEAEELIDWYESYLNKIKSRTEGLSEDKKPRVYFAWWKPGSLIHLATVGGVNGIPQCDIAGGRNINEELSISGYIDPEWLIVQDPDIIVKYMAGSDNIGYEIDDPSNIRALREKILNIPEFANVKAVKTGSVYLIDMRHFGAFGGPTIPISTAYFAKWFHPDIFEDLDPEAIHQEYVTRFQRIDFNVYEHGVWVWPPLE